MMKQIGYLRALLAFAFRENPLLYFALFISVISVAFEIAAVAALMPLAQASSGQMLSPDSYVAWVLRAGGLAPDGQGVLLLFICLMVIRVTSQFTGQALVAFIGRRLILQMTTRAFHALLGIVPIRDVERASIGSYITLAGDESFRASTVVTQLCQLLAQGALGCLYFAAIWGFSGKVALAVIVFLIVTFVLLFEAFRTSHRLGNIQVEQSNAVGSLFLDALNGLRSVRAYSAEQFVEREYRFQLRKYMKTLFFIDAISLLTRLGPALLLFAAAAIYTYFSASTLENTSDLMFLVTGVILLMRFFPVTGQALTVALKVVSDARAGRDVTELVGQHRPHVPGHVIATDASPLVEEVVVHRLGFSHVPGKPVLHDVSLHFRRGQSYALIGRSGSGKSTFMDLLLRFYAPDSGEIRLGSVDIQSMDERILRQRILLVTQDVTIFNDTVGNNIRFGASASDEEIMRACRIACIDDLVADLPQGLNTLLTYRGTNLSGGQRQRIGLARALLRRPAVLLLDESTSALDAATRTRVIENLLTEYRDKILIFVTHDSQVIESVDVTLDMAQINRASLQGEG